MGADRVAVASAHARRGRDQLSRGLTFAGALIVFATFVVKDGLQSSLKTSVQSLELATQAYTVRDDISQQQSELAEVQNDVTALRIKSENSASKAFQDASRAAESVGVMIDHTSKSIYITTGLLDALPGDASAEQIEFRRQLGHESTANNDLSIQEKADEDGLQALSEILGTNVKSAAADTQSLMQKFYSRYHEASERYTQVSKTSAQVFSAARLYRQTLNERYQRYTNVSYGLYFLGWCLAVAGRVFGVQGFDVMG